MNKYVHLKRLELGIADNFTSIENHGLSTHVLYILDYIDYNIHAKNNKIELCRAVMYFYKKLTMLCLCVI